MKTFIFQIATNRRMTVKYNPPSSCILEISVKGIKLTVQEDYYACDRVRLLLCLCPPVLLEGGFPAGLTLAMFAYRTESSWSMLKTIHHTPSAVPLNMYYNCEMDECARVTKSMIRLLTKCLVS